MRGTETQEFTFEYQGDKTTQAVYEFTFEDVQTSVELSKADLTDGKELPGASLQVLDSNGTVVEEWISTDEPHLIRGLLVGETYTMVETKPADATPPQKVLNLRWKIRPRFKNTRCWMM